MRKYVLGIDGGGTKSHLAIFDDHAEKAAFRTFGTLNHECMAGSFAQLEHALGTFINGALRDIDVGIDQIEYGVFGLAGVDTKKQHKKISSMLKRIGISKFTLSNDAFLGIPAGSPDGTGICAINGTGCSVAGKDKNGKAIQVGGMGEVSGDLGGASCMGMAATSAIYNSLFRLGEPTVMTDIVFKQIGITEKDKYDFMEIFMEKLEKKEFKISRFNRLLFEAAGLGDKVARDVLAGIAQNYAGAINYLLQELDFPANNEMCVVFAGSVFVKGEHPFLIDTIKELIEKRNPGRKINYLRLEKPPVTGAIAEAMNMIGRNDLVHEVYRQF